MYKMHVHKFLRFHEKKFTFAALPEVPVVVQTSSSSSSHRPPSPSGLLHASVHIKPSLPSLNHVSKSTSSPSTSSMSPNRIVKIDQIEVLKKISYVSASSVSTQTSHRDRIAAADLFYGNDIELDVCGLLKSQSPEKELQLAKDALMCSQKFLIIELKSQVSDLTRNVDVMDKEHIERDFEMDKYAQLVLEVQIEYDKFKRESESKASEREFISIELQNTLHESHKELEKSYDFIIELDQKFTSLKAKHDAAVAEVEENNEKVNQLRSIMLSKYTEDEIRVIFGDIKKVGTYPVSTVAKYTILSALGKNKYEMVRKLVCSHWPSYRTLQRKRQKIKMHPGMSELGMKLLKARFSSLSPKDLKMVLGFDHTTIGNKVEFDGKRVVDSNLLLIVKAKSLMGTCEQVVYTSFEKDFKKHELMKIISELHEIGYDVRAISSDNGSINQKLWKTLRCGVKRVKRDVPVHFFKHPETGRNIYMFSDMTHNIKLFRNHLIIKKLLTPSGALVDISPIKALQNDGTRISVRLTNDHFNPFLILSTKKLRTLFQTKS